MTGWIRGKIVYLYLHSAENNYYNCYDVLQTKSNIRGVLGTIFNFVMCCTQNHTFTMSCTQISQKEESVLQLCFVHTVHILSDRFSCAVTKK